MSGKSKGKKRKELKTENRKKKSQEKKRLMEETVQ